MRTNIDIDDDLIAEAMAVMGLATRRATVEEALRRLVRRHQRLKALSDMAGLGWDGDLDMMRRTGQQPTAVVVVDSSVWIANLRGTDNEAVRKLHVFAQSEDDQLLVGDLILLQVLQGARDEAHATRIERNLSSLVPG